MTTQEILKRARTIFGKNRYSELSKETREKMDYVQILTLYQVLNYKPEHQTPYFREKLEVWLVECVLMYEGKYMFSEDVENDNAREN